MSPSQPEFDLWGSPEPDQPVSQPAQTSLQGQPAGPAPDDSGRISQRSLLMEQVMRDRRVLDEDECCHIPSTDFFVDRIVAYLKAIEEMT